MSKTKENSKFLTAQEVADLLGVSAQTIKNWEASGILSSFKGGLRSKFYPRTTINKFINKFENLAQIEGMLEERIKQTKKLLEDYSEFVRDLTNRQPHQVHKFAEILNKIAYSTMTMNEDCFDDVDRAVLRSVLEFKSTAQIAEELQCSTQRIQQLYGRLEERIEKTLSMQEKYDQMVSETNRLKKENEELLARLAERDNPETVVENAKVDILKLSIRKFGFSNRVLNIFNRLGINFMYQLTNFDPRKLWITRSFGAGCAKEINEVFAKHSLSFVNFPKGLETRYSVKDFYDKH
ncbi:MAG: helix-turn-helix domain-containing protein [Bacteroidales bacterium]|nr:helix-turn-helix domain-containing protein [Bacteroidales bacterium]